MSVNVFNVLVALGVLSTSVGAGLVYTPAAFIVGGLLIIGLTVGLALRVGVRG